MLFTSELEIVSFEVKPRPPNRVIVAIARMGSSSLSDQLSNQSEGSSFPLTLNEFLTVLGPKKKLKSLRDMYRQSKMIVSTNIAKYCLLTQGLHYDHPVVCLGFRHHAKSSLIHRKMVVDCPFVKPFSRLVQTRKEE